MVNINWESIAEKAAKSYKRFVYSYAETGGVEVEYALEEVYRVLIANGVEVNEPSFS